MLRFLDNSSFSIMLVAKEFPDTFFCLFFNPKLRLLNVFKQLEVNGITSLHIFCLDVLDHSRPVVDHLMQLGLKIIVPHF